MRFKLFVAVVVTTVFTGFVNPSAALAATPPAGDPSVPIASCANPPSNTDATPENRDRFVALWSKRIADKAWLNNWMTLDKVPDDIVAEGFGAMSQDTQAWLESCLLDNMLAKTGETPDAAKRAQYLTGLHLIIFGKAEIASMRKQLTNAPPVTTAPQQKSVQADQTAQALKNMSQNLISDPSLKPVDQPKTDVVAPTPTVTTNLAGQTTPALQTLVNAPPVKPQTSTPKAIAAPATVPSVVPNPITSLPLVPQVLAAVNAVLQLVAKIQGVLFTIPGISLLASVFYKVCAESPTMPLSCSISLPIGVPNLVDVTGDNFPDVIATLSPLTNLVDVGAQFQVQRLTNSGPLPAHVFVVYDTPIVKKRIEFGFDGRASTLGFNNLAKFNLRNVVKAVTGDIQADADVKTSHPGSTESLTFAVKDLVGGSIGVPPSEENPIAGAAQMSPFPEQFTAGVHFTNTSPRNEDVFTVASSTPTKVDAIVDQRTTTTPVKSNTQFTASIDKLPTSVTVDLIRDGQKQSIDYTGSAPIDTVSASDLTIPDVTQPTSFTQSTYAVNGVPTHVHVDLQGAQDIKYSASAKIPQVSFATQTNDSTGIKQQITAVAHQIPQNVHVVDATTPDSQAITYTADDKLGDVQLGMYDRSAQGVTTNVTAKATSIPTQMAFTQTNSTGVYDFSANDGIGLIEATVTRNGGAILPMPGKDHVTVVKNGDSLGADFRLSGFKSAHFDGSQNTSVALGLSPGGQSFDAVADLDSPNVLAKAHVSALPANMAVTLSPTDGKATYSASSVIPELDASFTKRDTNTFASATLTSLPKNIGLTFNTTGATPQVTYNADSRLGSIDVTYSEKPGGLAIHGLISDLPQYLNIGGIDPIVFDARTAPGDPAGSSYLGQVSFQYATDGVFASPPTTDDHVALDTTGGGTHAELQYSGLSLLTVDTSNQQLHAHIKNTTARLFRAYLTTPTLTLTGFIDKVPADIQVAQVGNEVTYNASSSIHEITTDLNRANGDHLAVQIKDVPNSIDLLFDGANSKLGWDSSANTGLVSALAHLTPDTIGGTRAFDAGLTITDIPTHWDASWANGDVLFRAPGSIGTIAAQVTNHGAYHVLSGDHLSAFYDQASGDLDASLQISNLRKAGFTKLTDASGGGFEAVLNMGSQGDFKFAADVTLNASKLKADGEFNHLPSAIDLKSDGGRITYDGNSNPDLTVSVQAGTPAALAVTPTPNNVHGVSVRDGANGADIAVKANLYLTGLPDHLDLNSPAGTYEVDGYHPTNDTLVVDAVLTALVPQPLSLQLQQKVPTSSPVNFKFGPFTSSTAGDGTHNLSLNYTANQDLGALTAEAVYGNTDDAKLEISTIPSSISVNAAFGADQKTVGVAMSHGISDITASYKKAGDLNFAASVHLHDVPSAVNLLIGRGTASDGTKNVSAPDFTFTASQPGLDIDATATAAIATPVDAHAAVDLMITNMGSTVTGQLDGTSLKINSSPATEKFLLDASGGLNLNVDLGFSAGPLTNTGSLGVNLDIKKLTLGFENATNLQLDLGITTGLKGDYTKFTFGIDSDTQIDLQDKLRLVIGTPFGDVDINIFNLDPTHIDLHNVIDHFRLASNREDVVFSLDIIDVGLGYCSFDISVRPHYEFSTSGSSFSVGQPPSDSNPPAWLIAPDPNLLGFSLPDFVMDVVMYFTSPYGHAIDGSLGCHSRV